MSDTYTSISEQIANGSYTLSHRRKGRSFIWNILAEIMKKDGTVLEGWVYCRTCHKLLKYMANQSSNLNRHKCCQTFNQPSKTVTENDRKDAIDACTEWVIEDCHPYSVINGSGFLNIVNFFIKIGANYGENVNLNDLLPDPITISRKVQELADEKKMELKSEINEVIKSGSASATIDMWTDNYVKRNFLGVTLHYLKDYKLFGIILGIKSMDLEKSTDENILKKLQTLFAEFGVENIEAITFITDRQSNIVKALEGSIRLNCSSHLLANVLDKSFDETDELRDLYELCNEVVKSYKKSNPQHSLQSYPKNSCPTRWNSYYTMFKSVLCNWHNINEVLTNNDATLFPKDIVTLQILVELCGNFEIVFKKIQLFNSPSLCYVIPSINKIKSLCVANKTDIPLTTVLKAIIAQNIDDIWVENLSVWHKTALFLFPPVASTTQQNDVSDIKNFCISHIQNLEIATLASTSQPALKIQSVDTTLSSIKFDPTSPTKPPSPVSSALQTSFTSSSTPSSSPIHDIHFFFPDLFLESSLSSPETPRSEVERYSREIVKMTEDFNPIEWWKMNANNYPRLSQFALKVHSIPASSAVADQAFSLVGNVLTEKLNRLGPKTVDSLLYLRSYFKEVKK